MRKYTPALLFLLLFVFYLIFSYAGTRSADAEIVYRTAESLESSGEWDVKTPLHFWKGFGMAPGIDGKNYSIFGPAEPVLMVPFIRLGRIINRTGWYKPMSAPLAISHYLGKGGLNFVHDRPLYENREGHALRMFASILLPLTSAIAGVLFYLLILRVAGRETALAMTMLWAFGTMIWHYSGAMMSEPLAVTFALGSFYLLVRSDPAFAPEGSKPTAKGMFGAGILLGLCVSTHITGILFAPFWFFYALSNCIKSGESKRRSLYLVTLFTGGTAIFGVLLAYYNFIRFGSVLETGRSVDPRDVVRFYYGVWVNPGVGLYGLLFSPGKGLALYCPAMIAGLVAYRALLKKQPVLLAVVLAEFFTRLIFIASRSDWHGGFCLGPRYLMLSSPFVLIPLALWLKDKIDRKSRPALALFAALSLAAIAQQAFYSVGEIFSYLIQINKTVHIKEGIDLVQDYTIYMDWKWTPAFHLLLGKRSPFITQYIAMSNNEIWFWSVVLVWAFVAPILYFSLRPGFKRS